MAGSLNSNFFAYPLMGCNDPSIAITIQRRRDGINPGEMINYMFKKQFGIPNTLPYIKYGDEAQLPFTAINNSTLDKQYSQEIPLTPPSIEFIAEDSNFNRNGLYNSDSKRYISINKPYIVYYENILMRSIDSTSYYAGYYEENEDITYYLSQNAISPFYGNSSTISSEDKYSDKLRVFCKNNNETYTQLNFGESSSGDWLLDCDTGILTFYDNISIAGVRVNIDEPPKISFWRYEGLIGNNTVMSVKDF